MEVISMLPADNLTSVMQAQKWEPTISGVTVIHLTLSPAERSPCKLGGNLRVAGPLHGEIRRVGKDEEGTTEIIDK